MAVALAIGLLIGLERGWQQREEAEGERTAGLRTHALTGLLGGICAALSAVSHPIVLAAALACFTAAFTLFAWFEAVSEQSFSVTGVVAAILTFALGAYAVLGDQLVAVAAAGGLYLLAAISGIADVDALTLSMARLSASQIALAEAATAIIIAVCINTASKAAMAATIAGRTIGATVGTFSALAIAAMGLVHLLAKAHILS